LRIANAAALAVALASIALGRAPAAASAPHVSVIDDAVTGKAMLGRFEYVGHWQRVSGKHDGRTNGTSTRSTRVSDVAILRFSGTRARIYGVVGPSGGQAGIALDGNSTGGKPVDFYAPHLRPHALIYQSPILPAGVHTIAIAVWGTRDERGHFYYVNIDGAEIES